MKPKLLCVVSLVFGLGVGCSYEAPPRFTESQTLGGEVISAQVLNEGQEAYGFYCISCHGRDGDGRGVASSGLLVPPRDFRLAAFKFGGVTEGLPHDEDLMRLVRQGLAGTVMLPWEVPDKELHAIIQYIKTFSPPDEGWRDPEEEKGERLVVGTNPWEASATEAISRGEAVFHGKAACNTCHPTYVTKEEVKRHRHEAAPGGHPGHDHHVDPANMDIRPRAWLSLPQLTITYSRPIAGDPPCSDDPECGKGNVCRFGRCEAGLRVIPPDFTYNKIKNGTDVSRLFSVLSTGVPGTAMPAWRGAIPDKDLWALAHYVEHLATMDSGEARALRQRAQKSLEQ